MSYSLNDLNGVIRGITIGVTKGEARCLDESSYMIVQYSDPSGSCFGASISSCRAKPVRLAYYGIHESFSNDP